MSQELARFTQDNSYVPVVVPEQELGDALGALIALFNEQNPVVIIRQANGNDLVVVNTQFAVAWNVNVTSANGVYIQGHTSPGPVGPPP